jgi:hypothetical protein
MAHGILLQWTAPSDANASTVYNIYRGTAKGAENLNAPINPSPVAGTSYNDLNAPVGQPEFYVVEAVTNGVSSGPSIEVTATVLPYPPTGVTATAS